MSECERNHSLLLVFLFLVCLGSPVSLCAYPVSITDSGGTSVVLTEKPQRVVSLVPAVTEIILQLGAGDLVKGLTYHDTHLPEANKKDIMGGFLAPSPARIEALDPDVVFLSSLHKEVRAHLSRGKCRMLETEIRSIKDLYENILQLGRIFEREQAAEEIVRNIRDELQLISRKIAKIPEGKRKRVMRVMGCDPVVSPGDDSFQNEFIRVAGGVPPCFGKMGSAVEVTLEEWKRFDPQVVYACTGDREAAEKLFAQPYWKDVEAVREGRVFYFPCDLTCRASVHTAEFVAWLASAVYNEEFSIERDRVLNEEIIRTNPVEIQLDYVRSARVDETTIFDFPNKTLIVEFKEPVKVTSTLEGERSGILGVGNHYLPPSCWSIAHRLGFDTFRNHICKTIGKSKEDGCFLFTGADMGNLSVRKESFKDMTVYALVTAGVETNAVRMSVDEGRFYEPGTINVIVMTNMKLTSRAMARAIISATEAKTAAMQDLDVRSGTDPRILQATGTGTDEVLVVEGRGRPIDNAGGHCKMGELIAKAVYNGVKEAVYRQNGIMTRRSVLRRLQERQVGPHMLLKKCACFADQTNGHRFLARLEELLLQPRYAAFMESAFALSDAYERGLVLNLESFEMWCHSVAEEIAGRKMEKWEEKVTAEEIPIVIRMSLNALINGLILKKQQEQPEGKNAF